MVSGITHDTITVTKRLIALYNSFHIRFDDPKAFHKEQQKQIKEYVIMFILPVIT